MKNITLILAVTITLFSCNSMKKVEVSNIENATNLLNLLDANSSFYQIDSLFLLLDTNADDSISSTEAIGIVSENFTTLDTDRSANLNFTELKGLLAILP